MQNNSGSELKPIILKGLRRDPDALLLQLLNGAGDTAITAFLKHKLDSINTVIGLEEQTRNQRKALSRKIGPAKRNNEDCSDLIEQMAVLSAQVDRFGEQLKNEIQDIKSAINNRTEVKADSEPSLPIHLVSFPTANSDASTGEISVTHAEQHDTTDWQAYVASIPSSSVYHDLKWQAIIQKNFGHDCHYLIGKDSQNNVVGVLPLVHLKSHLFGSFTISIPYFNYGGPLADDMVVEEALLSHAASLSNNLGCSHMEVRETRPRSEWKSVQRKVSMILPLPQTEEQLDAALGSKIRAQVNKSAQHQLVVKFGGIELLDYFYTVFSQNMRDLGTPVYGRQFFHDILTEFPDLTFVAIVLRHDQPLAVGFLLGHNDKLEIPWASSIRSQNHLGANMFMYRSILRQAITRKYQYFDFGRSTRGSSTYKFKKQWGAVEHPLHWHYWTQNNDEPPEINPDNPKYKLVIRAWQKLPVFVTRIIGPLISKNLP